MLQVWHNVIPEIGIFQFNRLTLQAYVCLKRADYVASRSTQIDILSISALIVSAILNISIVYFPFLRGLFDPNPKVHHYSSSK